MSADVDRLRREARLFHTQARSQTVAAGALRERAEAAITRARAEAAKLTAEARLIADNLEEHAEALDLRAADYHAQADVHSLRADYCAAADALRDEGSES